MIRSRPLEPFDPPGGGPSPSAYHRIPSSFFKSDTETSMRSDVCSKVIPESRNLFTTMRMSSPTSIRWPSGS